ncbi:hypothetical protein V6N12_050202 [Hibiscus sabdariffa]|uniref:Reverse transcriptase zinc-binding domain-containing protein n=1 Tax=Hibiscus sabdariffa TaxID=183260 RepID=A0ABR2GCX6_9ROSI
MVRFLWGGSADKKKVHWLSWSDVCQPIHLGGLGIFDLCTKNRALLGKWFWRFVNEQNNVWKRTVSSKYNIIPVAMLPSCDIPNKASWIWRGICESFFASDEIGQHF